VLDRDWPVPFDRDREDPDFPVFELVFVCAMLFPFCPSAAKSAAFPWGRRYPFGGRANQDTRRRARSLARAGSRLSGPAAQRLRSCLRAITRSTSVDGASRFIANASGALLPTALTIVFATRSGPIPRASLRSSAVSTVS
jgi:hypothetical protein